MNFNFEKLRSQDASVTYNVNNNFKLNGRFGKDPAKSDSTKSYKNFSRKPILCIIQICRKKSDLQLIRQ